MRKFVWAGTAVVVLCAAAVYLAADYAARYPHSWFGRCAYVAGYIGSQCNPFAGLGASLAHQMPPADEPQVCEGVQKPKPGFEADVIPAVIHAEEPKADASEADINEPIKVEPHTSFVVPFEPEETSVVPPSEETPEPSFGPEEESEYPSPEVAAPAGEEEDAAPPAMSYVEDDPPACPKCGKCTTGCCEKGTCTKRGAKGCCETGDCCKTGANSCCDASTCTKRGAKGCCEKGECCKTGTTGCCDKSTCTKCGTGGCCAQGCCGWFMSFFGIHCGKCCTDDTITTPAVNDDLETFSGSGISGSSTEENAPKNEASKSDDVPNAQEDPSYDHQYPSCPYTGCPSTGCMYPYYNHAPVPTPEDTSSDEAVHPKKKRKKTASPSQVRTQGGIYDPQEPGERVDTPAATTPLFPIKPMKKPTPGEAEEESEAHPEVDTMEARPTDLERDPFATDPF
jgi:hypothetical protein